MKTVDKGLMILNGYQIFTTQMLGYDITGYKIVVSTEATETGTRRETGSCRPKWFPIPTTAVT